jgi:hypothetical protein
VPHPSSFEGWDSTVASFFGFSPCTDSVATHPLSPGPNSFQRIAIDDVQYAFINIVGLLDLPRFESRLEKPMTTRCSLFLRITLTLFFAVSPCLSFICGPLAWGEGSPSAKGRSKVSFRIEVQDAQGVRISGPDLQTTPSEKPAALVFNRQYQPGDRLVFGGPRRMAVRLDESMPECILYLPNSDQGNISYEIPFGREEKQTGSAYAPQSFAGESHRVSVRTLDKHELKGYRNLALNPCDLRQSEEAAAQIFPHASTNSVSRSLFDFEARNAIDGVTQNGHHGVWPFQSWGPQLRTDLWWKLEFGRPVELNKIRLMVRADFPHDSYWKSAEVEFSDGSHVSIQIGSSPEFQDFPFPKRRVSWLRITNLVPVDSARWCSFIEVEAWGRDRP